MGCEGHLVYDSASVGRRAGAPAALAAERALLYRADGLAVDVVVHGGGGALHVLHGQVHDERAGAPLVAAQIRFGDDAAPVETDRRGHFAVSAVVVADEPPLWIDAPGRQVRCTLPAGGHAA